jgi:hypothetical protein
MTGQNKQYIEFAGKIAELADDEQYDHTTRLNGTAIAAAAFLADYTVDLDGNVRTHELAEATAQFVQTLQQATKFAAEQLKNLINENSQGE